MKMQSSSWKITEQASALDQDHWQKLRTKISSKNCACQRITKGLARAGESQTWTVQELVHCFLLQGISIALEVSQNKQKKTQHFFSWK